MDKGAFESKLEEREKASHPNIWKNFPSKLSRKCKDPEEGVCSEKDKEASVAGGQ